MSLTPSNKSVKGSYLKETISPLVNRYFWQLMLPLAAATGAIVAWMFGGKDEE